LQAGRCAGFTTSHPQDLRFKCYLQTIFDEYRYNNSFSVSVSLEGPPTIETSLWTQRPNALSGLPLS
jgi:hypothetical protein